MARLIPKVSVEEIQVKPERDVARALTEKLPEECIVYHSYPWLKLDRSDLDRSHKLKEGETDFVVVDPLYGILILEVKGGHVEFDPTYHKWYRILGDDNKKEIKDPFSQARESMHFLKDQIWKNSFPDEQYIPCAFGYAVVFPDCEYAGPMTHGAAMTHGHPSGYLSAGFLAEMISGIVEEKGLQETIAESKNTLVLYDGHEETLEKVELAEKLASGKDRVEDAITEIGEGWVGEEAFGIALYCALKFADDFKAGVVAAVNHSGDSDSTGSITGAILGTLLGVEAIPVRWIERLENSDDIDNTACEMFRIFKEQPSDT